MAAANSWHRDIKTWKERNEFLMKNEIMADCKFIIIDGTIKTIIPAHKYILGGNSAEFYNLFYLMKSSDEIPIEDTSADDFTTFLQFLYTEKATLTVENVGVLLKLAKRYSVSNFETLCCEFLSKHVNKETALSIMDKYSGYHIPNLMDKCASLISQNHPIIGSPEFSKISIETLTCLLKSEKLAVKELTIFKGVNKWAENFCQENNLEVISENKRVAVKPALEYIRFASMTLNDFALCTMNSSVLTLTEIVQIMQSIASNGEVECKFSAKKRPTANGKIIFDLILDDSKIGKEYWKLDKNFDILSISVNTPIHLLGIEIFGSTEFDWSSKPIIIKLKDEKETVLIESKLRVNFYGTPKRHILNFHNAMLLTPGKTYKVGVYRRGVSEAHEYYSSMNCKSIINREFEGVQFIVISENNCASIIFKDY